MLYNIKIIKWWCVLLLILFTLNSSAQSTVSVLVTVNQPETCVVLGVPITFEATADFTINIFPNPVENNLTISTVDPILRIQIIDANGRNVFSKGKSSKQLIIDVSRFKKGFYTCVIETATGVGHSNILIK